MNDKFVEHNSFHTQNFLIFVYKYEFLKPSSLFIFICYILYKPKFN